MKKIRITTQSGDLVKELEGFIENGSMNFKGICYVVKWFENTFGLVVEEIEVEEKKPVIRWQWICCSAGKYGRTEGYYSEDEAKNFIGNVFGKKLIRKIENSAEEFYE